MNKFYAAIVVLIIFGLPAGSYYYLQKGYDFRKGALDEIEDSTELKNLVDADSFISIQDTLYNRISVIISDQLESKKILDVIFNLEEQFGMNDHFQMINATSKSIFIPLLQNSDMAIYDLDTRLRKTYSHTTDDLKSLVTHISILLPLPVEKDVILKRDLKQND